jgi:hypothetical protein
MRIIIKALTEQGKKGIELHRKDEDIFREKLKRMPKIQKVMLNKQTKAFMKTRSTFNDSEHIIEKANFKTPARQKVFVDGVKLAMIDNGCTLSDFEVLFENE